MIIPTAHLASVNPIKVGTYKEEETLDVVDDSCPEPTVYITGDNPEGSLNAKIEWKGSRDAGWTPWFYLPAQPSFSSEDNLERTFFWLTVKSSIPWETAAGCYPSCGVGRGDGTNGAYYTWQELVAGINLSTFDGNLANLVTCKGHELFDIEGNVSQTGMETWDAATGPENGPMNNRHVGLSPKHAVTATLTAVYSCETPPKPYYHCDTMYNYDETWQGLPNPPFCHPSACCYGEMQDPTINHFPCLSKSFSIKLIASLKGYVPCIGPGTWTALSCGYDGGLQGDEHLYTVMDPAGHLDDELGNPSLGAGTPIMFSVQSTTEGQGASYAPCPQPICATLVAEDGQTWKSSYNGPCGGFPATYLNVVTIVTSSCDSGPDSCQCAFYGGDACL